jgi:hypothetical protein
MQSDSLVVPPSGFKDFPALYSKLMVDAKTGKTYNAMMPLKPTSEGFDLVTVIPKGIQKNKTPKR